MPRSTGSGNDHTPDTSDRRSRPLRTVVYQALPPKEIADADGRMSSVGWTKDSFRPSEPCVTCRNDTASALYNIPWVDGEPSYDEDDWAWEAVCPKVRVLWAGVLRSSYFSVPLRTAMPHASLCGSRRHVNGDENKWTRL